MWQETTPQERPGPEDETSRLSRDRKPQTKGLQASRLTGLAPFDSPSFHSGSLRAGSGAHGFAPVGLDSAIDTGVATACALPGIRLAAQDGADVQFFELRFADGAGRVDHEVDGFGGFGKCDDLAQARRAGEDHDDAIKPEGNATMGRRAVLQSFEEESEALFRFFVGHAEGAEDL